jgi:hypothetical protein
MALAYDRRPVPRGPVQRQSGSASLAEVLNVILDKGIVIDAWVRISAVGIEVLAIEARVVIASVDTYLRYAEAIGTTELSAPPPARQGASARQNGQESAGELPSGEEVAGYLSDHPDGVRLRDLEAYFDVPRRELREVVNELIEDDRARRDPERQLYFAADDDD